MAAIQADLGGKKGNGRQDAAVEFLETEDPSVVRFPQVAWSVGAQMPDGDIAVCVPVQRERAKVSDEISKGKDPVPPPSGDRRTR